MAIEIRKNGRKVSERDLENLFDGVLDDILDSYADGLHAKAASVVDPETGKHAAVFVRRVGDQSISIHTNGSAAFARALEDRLGLNRGEVHGMSAPAERPRLVYLAHASEDKEIVKPLAEGLMARGIDVWYDNWEIGYGDSLRRKMEEGLGECTHFVVLLSKKSVLKPWVNEEIDAGLMGAVEGTAKFIGLRYDLPLAEVSPFLRTRLTPEYASGEEGIEALAAEIYGVSKKPALGEKPKYVRTHEAGSSWSASAKVVAEYFVRNSQHAQSMDPQTTYEAIQRETGLPMPDVRLGVLDLIGAGLLEKQDYYGGEANIWPKSDLFFTFDGDFMDWNPEADARDLAVYLLNLDTEQVAGNRVGVALGWEPRRFNSAASYLVGAKAVGAIEAWGDDNYWPYGFMMGDELLRFVRSI